MGILTRLACACALAASVACGGGGKGTISSTPTSPGPSNPVTPSVACGALGLTAGGSTAIVNGAECSTSRSAVVLLNMRDRSDTAVGACSGTIIAPRSILTAAHCLDDDVVTVRVWLGSGAEITAVSFSMHPSYVQNPGTALDVGIVQVAEDLPRAPIPLLTSRDAVIGESAVIAGWGRDQNNVSATLRAGATTVTGVSSTLLESQVNSTASSICAGDSGGPIMLVEGSTWAVAGVSSAASAVQCNAGTNFYVNLRNQSVQSFVLDRVPGAVRR